MQVAEPRTPTAAPRRRRVRDDVRDSLALVGFSLGASVVVAIALQLVIRTAG